MRDIELLADSPAPLERSGLSFAAVDPFHPETVGEVHRLLCAAAGTDLPDGPVPCPLDLAGSLFFSWPGHETETVLVRRAGVPAGVLRMMFPVAAGAAAQPRTASVDELVVGPAHRRQGIGRQLLAYALRRARARGRDQVSGTAPGPVAGGPVRSGAPAAFARGTGGRPGGVLVHSRLLLDRGAVRRPPPPEDYAPVHWGSVVPERFLADTAVLEAWLRHGGRDGEGPGPLDPARIRDFERMRCARQRHAWQAGLVHRASGRLVAWTSVTMTHSDPATALQGTTVVHPEHRGRRLGLLVKNENLHRLVTHEPALRRIDTFTAESNTAMAGVNHAMGFRPVDHRTTWQYTVPPLPAA